MKLIIISDLHFDENNDWDNINQINNCLITRINMKLKENERIVFVVLGDIVNRGGDGNNAVKFLEASRLLDEIKANISNAQFYFIPGNHEIKDYEIISEFHDFAMQYNSSYEHFTLEKSVFSEELEGFNFILADSTLGRKHDADGKIDVEKLKEHLKSNCRNLIFMHHPPCEQDGADRSLENSEELIATHANFVFYGHQHGYVKVPDFLENDTDIHSVGALFKTEFGVKNQFLLLDIADGRINYARRYDYISEYYHSQLMFPKKKNLQSHTLKLDTPKVANGFVNRKYKAISSNDSKNTFLSVFERLGGVNENTLMQESDYILIAGTAGMGKTYSLINMYNSMLESQDYFPIWLSLGNTNYETIKSHLSYAQYNTIDNKTPMLFFDGLDEMKSEYISSFMRDIGSSIYGDAEVKIVVSVRANYQISIDRFQKYELMSLTQVEIEQIAAKNSIKSVEDFINQINLNNCVSLSHNPYYLFEMINIYSKNNALPSKIELFDHMIKIRFLDSDERHKCDYSKSLMGDEFNLTNKLKKLSFFMNALQEYALENLKYTGIVEPYVREQFQKIGIITRTEKYPKVFWEFEHRNLSEFLTAKFLFNVNFEDLLHVITYDTDNKKLRPSWVNIIGFILILRDDKDLINWLVENAVDSLCELQPDSLAVDDRNVVFITLFKECSEKGIPIYVKHHGHSLAKYFQSTFVLDYLIDKLKESKTDHEVLNSLYFLQYCTEFYGKEDFLLKVIKERYISSDVVENIAMRAIKVVTAIASINQADATKEVIPTVKEDARIEIIGANCSLIAKTHTSDEHSEYLLEKLKNVTILQESYSVQKNLVEVVSTFRNTDNILRAVKILVEHEGYTRLYHKDELFAKLLETLCFNQEIDCKELVHIFIICSHGQKRTEINLIKQCFKHLKITETAFMILISTKLNDLDMLFAIESIMDDELITILIECYDNNKINSDIIKWYARRLPVESPIYLAINEAVLKTEGVCIEREPKIDWEQINKEGIQKYFDSLFDEEQFQIILDEVIKYYDSTTLCRDLLNDSFHSIPHERKDLRCVVTALLHSDMDDASIKDFMSQIDWEAFSIYQIIHILQQNDNIEVSQKQQDILTEYFMKMVTTTNFQEVPLNDYTIYIAKQMVFLIEQFNFNISDEKLLEFLALPWYVFESSTSSAESETLNYIKQRIQDNNKLHEKIISNLTSGDLNPYAMQAHIFYCLENKITDAVEVARDFLTERSSENSSLKNSAVEYLIAVKGENYVDDLVNESMDEHLLRYLSIKLKRDNNNLKKMLVQRNMESDDNLLFLEELIKLNSKYAMETYIKVAKEKGGIPDKHEHSSRVPEVTHAIRDITDLSLLDYVGELLVLSLTEGFEDNDSFGLFSSSIGAIRNLSRIDAVSVKAKLAKLIEDNPRNDILNTQCNYYISDIDKQINISSDIPWDEDKALEFIRKIKCDLTFI